MCVCVGLRVEFSLQLSSPSFYPHHLYPAGTIKNPIKTRREIIGSTEVQLILFTNLYSILFSTNKQIDRIL